MARARAIEVRGAGWIAEAVRARATGVRIVQARRGPRVPRTVSLTFDDGPSQWTPDVLDALAAGGARATFFVLGLSVYRREPILRRALADGHELGNHAYSHTDPATLDDETLRSELERTSALIVDAVGRRPTLFRPPYAGHDVRVARVARDAGLSPTVLRSIDPADWREPDPARIAAHVVERLQPGAIVCLHDGLPPRTERGTTDRRPTVDALPAILEGIAERELASVTVSELLGRDERR